MKNLFKRIDTVTSQSFAVPLALLMVTILAYGLSFWRLGFYWDDQPISWIRYQLGTAATTKYFSDSRPVWALLYQLTGYFMPLNPVYWQLFAMFWRWAGVYVFWLAMVRLFPSRRDIAFFLALLVLLYPGFNQQWVSYVYSHFFIVLFFLSLSWHLMLRGKTVPAMIFAALNLLMLEYFFLLEFMRPAFIFISLLDEPMTNRERLLKTFKTWLPYVGVIIFVVLYRLLVYTHPGFGYSLTDEIRRAPVATIIELSSEVLASLRVAAVGAWQQIFQFPNIYINGVYTSIVYILVVLAVSVLAFLFKRTVLDQKDSNKKSHAWWLISLGAIMLLLGGVPYWVTNLPVSLSFPANRAMLSFMFGSCFLLLGLIEFLPTHLRYVVAVLLISLSAGRQFLWSVDYLRDWQSQKNLFWQMTWRAPGIKPDTLVLLNEGALNYYADNSIGAALNWIYAPDNHTRHVEYMLFYPKTRLRNALPELKTGIPISYDYLAAQFNGNTSQTLAMYYAPPGCLRILDSDIERLNRLIPENSLMRFASTISDPDLIVNEPLAKMPAMYGPEPAHGWCYFFEKADLARQFGDWNEVAKLGNQAFQLNDSPNDPAERFAFIEGYAHVGNWDRAIELSKVSYQVSKKYMGPMLCRLWRRIGEETADSPERSAALSKTDALFGCNP